MIVTLIFNGIAVTGSISKNNKSFNQQNIDTYILQVTFPNPSHLRIVNDENYQRIEHKDFGYLTSPGKPMLPVKNFLIALPPGAVYKSVEITDYSLVEISGIYDIIPYPMIYPLDGNKILLENLQNEWDENHKNTYYSSEIYPEKSTNIKNIGTLRKYSYVSLSVCPFKYNPQSGELFYFDSCNILIHYSVTEDVDEFKNDALFDEKASCLFINFEQIKELYETNDNGIISTYDTFDYVIITSDELVDSVTNSAFVDWKTELGFNVKIISISDTLLTSQSGKDLAEKIRNFLREYYATWGTKYVLFVGDYTTIPMRYCSPNPYWLEGTVPTDTYYADLSLPDEESWDSNGDGYYGVYGQDNPDFLAEVYIGRIPTNDISRITYTLDKIVSFEQDAGDWKDNALHGGAMLFYANEDHDYEIDFDIDGARLIDRIEKDIMKDWTTVHYSEQDGLSPSIYNWSALNEPAFTNEWRNDKYAIVNWAAHGAPASIGRVIWDWDDGDNVPEHDNGELTWGRFLDTYCILEDDYPSIVFAVSCNVGYPEPTVDGNLGIDMLTKESFGSAVAVCSATRGAAVSADWVSSHSGAEALCYEFNNFLINSSYGPQPIGDALYDSKFYVHDNFGWDHQYEFMNMYDYNLYGDPSMIRQGTTSGAPFPPIIDGAINGKMKVEYNYSIKSIDPTEDDLFYYIDWGDDNVEEWIGPYMSGEEVIVSHKWSQQGTYNVRVKTRDTDNKESDWATLEVSMPKSKSIFQWFHWFIEQHPMLEKLFYH